MMCVIQYQNATMNQPVYLAGPADHYCWVRDVNIATQFPSASEAMRFFGTFVQHKMFRPIVDNYTIVRLETAPRPYYQPSSSI